MSDQSAALGEPSYQVGDTVEVGLIVWVPMQVTNILLGPKSERVREVRVYGIVDGAHRSAWVQTRYVRPIQTEARNEEPSNV